MNYNEQVWEEYLSSRPNFNKWCHYCLNSKKHDYLSSRFSFMQNMIETGGKTEHGRKVTDLTDGEALAYFMYPYIDVGLVLAESKAVKPFQPSINFDEAKYMDDNSTIATWVGSTFFALGNLTEIPHPMSTGTTYGLPTTFWKPSLNMSRTIFLIWYGIPSMI